MRPRFLTITLFLVTAFSAAAQEEPQEATKFNKTYSIELGTGLQPFYMNGWVTPSSYVKDELAKKGQSTSGPYSYPVLSLTGVMRISRRSEHILTLGTTWCHHQIVQYPESGGFDPEGKPRYNSKEGEIVGWANTSFEYSITWQWRHLWTPDRLIVLYTGVGLGVYSERIYAMGGHIPLPVVPVPDVTPLGLRIGGEHFYGFAEATFGPIATLAHGGLGWRF